MKEPSGMRASARAFVFIKTAPRRERDIAEKLLTYDEVMETHIIAGKWDVLAVLEVRRDILDRTQKKVLDFVIEKVEAVRGVQDTNTIIPEYSKTKFPLAVLSS